MPPAILIPLLLVMLSLVLGGALRRAAGACHAAASAADAALARAALRLAVEEPEGDSSAAPTRVRVAGGDDPLRHVRAVTPEQAQREAIRAASRGDPDDLGDAEAWADRKATEEAERWEPPAKRRS